MSKKLSKRYCFSLVGVDIDKINEKYGLLSKSMHNEAEIIPFNVTKIDDVISKKQPEIISFLDESKRLRKCNVSMIDFENFNKIDENYFGKKNYKCFWDRNIIPKNIQPIGCPIKFVPDKIIKTYHSEISKEKYSITEYITSEKMQNLKTDNIHIENKNYYLTDGIFCSFNCCIAYIQSVENKKNPLYRFSENLLIKMYNEINPENQNIEIIPAPHWRMLSDFGGSLSIEEFRESFNKIRYVHHGTCQIKNCSIGNLYEDQIKF